jgi:hypothetical protein
MIGGSSPMAESESLWHRGVPATGKNTAAISVGSWHFPEQFAPLASGLYISENGQGALKRFFVSATYTWVSWSVLAAAL